jgi:hypothetical protein
VLTYSPRLYRTTNLHHHHHHHHHHRHHHKRHHHHHHHHHHCHQHHHQHHRSYYSDSELEDQCGICFEALETGQMVLLVANSGCSKGLIPARLHIGPFALLAEDRTPFHSKEPNGFTLPSAMKKMQSKVVQNSPKQAVLDHF